MSTGTTAKRAIANGTMARVDARLGGKMRKPTIYEALKEKLGRDPTDAEVKADVQRILKEARTPWQPIKRRKNAE